MSGFTAHVLPWINAGLSGATLAMILVTLGYQRRILALLKAAAAARQPDPRPPRERFSAPPASIHVASWPPTDPPRH